MSSISRAATLGRFRHAGGFGCSWFLLSGHRSTPLCRGITRFTLATQPARLLSGLMMRGQFGNRERQTVQRSGRTIGFVRGAQLSREGKSILTAYSTAVGDMVSRIVPQIEGPATDPRADTQYIDTEYGMADMRGKSSPERAEALIAIAHPRFREELRQRARDLGYL